jgi:two-component system, cell cycle sensor histidine kinase and response regulator CckA
MAVSADRKKRARRDRRALKLRQRIAHLEQLVARLTEEQHLLRTVIDTTPDLIFVKDRESRFVLGNRALLDLLGFEHLDQLVGRSDFDFFPAALAERYYADERHVIDEGRVQVNHEEPFYNPDGRRQLISSTKLPLRDPEGRIIGLVGINRDLTERWRAEVETRHRLELERCVAGISKHLVSLIWTDIGPGIDASLATIGEFARADRSYLFLANASSRTLSIAHEWCAAGIEPQGERLQNISMASRQWAMDVLLRGEALHIPQVAALPPEANATRAICEQQGIRSLLQVPLYTGETLIGILGFDAVREERRWHDSDLTLLTMVGELLVHAIDRQRVGEERLQLERSLLEAQRRESLGVLAGGIAHDFNNMLAIILGNAELALAELPQESHAHALLTPLTATARHAADLTRQLLAYAGRGRFVVEPLDLNALIASARPLLKATIPHSIVLKLELVAGLPPIAADAAQIHQIIMNLVINAVEAITASGSGGTIGITTCCEADARGEPRVVLQVRDSGCGMDSATLARIFEPFFTTKFTGRGLGLAAVQGIARGHKAELSVESASGAGSVFRVSFPALRDAAPSSVDQPGSAAWSGSGTVLVVDDEPEVRAVARRMLHKLGLAVLVAEDGQQALEVFRQAKVPIRCVLLDLTMPQLGGEQTFRALRQIDPTVRVVVMSGYAEDEIAGRFAGQQLSGFLHKPFGVADLQSVIRRALEMPAARG